MLALLCVSAGFLFQMYQAALSVQDDKRVRMVTFEGSLGYLHNGLYKDPRLPAIIKWETFHYTDVLDEMFGWQIEIIP